MVIKDNLASIQKDESWLLNEIRQRGAKTVEEVLYAEWLEEEPLLVQKYEG
ncbi:YetF domain-containing protein [Peribacillus tepidiphilus]